MTEMWPDITVIMPMLNVRQYVIEAVESVLGQTWKNIEVICVDAESSDGTLDVLRNISARDPRVHIVTTSQKSYGHQMNVGIDCAHGRYLAIVEADDYVESDMLESLLSVADSAGLDFVKADFDRFTGASGSRSFFQARILPLKSMYGRVVRPISCPSYFAGGVQTWCGLYRREFIVANAIRYNESPGAAYQDNGFWFQTMVFANRVLFLRKTVYHLRRDNPASSMSRRDNGMAIFGEYRFIKEFVLSRPKSIEMTMPLFCVCQYNAYFAHFHRIDESLRFEYIKCWADELREMNAHNELFRRHFSGRKWKRVKGIMDDPQKFLREMTLSYQMIPGGWRRCVYENGWPYTIIRAIEHLFRMV